MISLASASAQVSSRSTPAIRATLACLTPRARAEAAGLTRDAAAHRRDFARRLTDLGLRPVPGAAPFVLVDTVSNWMGSRCDTPRKTPQTSDDPIQLLMEGPRRALAQRGFAVRRGETFPGLGPSWLRPWYAVFFAALLAGSLAVKFSGRDEL